MTRTEMREAKKKQFIKNLIVVLTIFIVSFVLGFLTHWIICQFTHEDIHKVELCGEATIYLVNEESGKVEDTVAIKPDEEIKLEGDTSVEPETEPEEEFTSYYTYTEEELDLLARLIYSEGGTESYETQLKIGSVVMNRVEDSHFPNTIREVIYQKNQFSVTTIEVGGVIMIDRPADEESIRAAREILDYGSVLPPDVQVFYASYLLGEDNWVTTRKVYEVCDNTVFSYIYAG